MLKSLWSKKKKVVMRPGIPSHPMLPIWHRPPVTRAASAALRRCTYARLIRLSATATGICIALCLPLIYLFWQTKYFYPYGEDHYLYPVKMSMPYNRVLPHSHSTPFPGWLFYLLAFCTLSSSVIAFAGFLWWWCCRRTRRGTQEQHNEELGRAAMAPRRYEFREVAAATSNSAESRRIGQGGFGAVYRGLFIDTGHHIAVKVLSPDSAAQGKKEFEAEVKIIGRLRHRSLVQLLGWCDCRKGLLLVYELVPEGGLDKHLHNPDRLLNWRERYKITLDLGSAILYLHTECEQCVVHGDIKPSNVIFGSSHAAKLGDFGLARLADHGAEPLTTQVVAGTIGYIDPDFVNTGRPSTESDVYSFGVVLLEIACGKRPMVAPEQPDEAPTLLRCVRDMYHRGAILAASDRRLNGEFDRRQIDYVLVTGLWCTHYDRGRRPSIAQAMKALRSGDASLPMLPGFNGPRPILHLEEPVYRELSGEGSGSTRSSATTAYHTPADSGYINVEKK